MRKALCAALGWVTFVGLAAVAAAQRPAERSVDAARDKPDFTGVWTNYTGPGQAGGRGGGHGAGSGLPFTEEARKKIADQRRGGEVLLPDPLQVILRDVCRSGSVAVVGSTSRKHVTPVTAMAKPVRQVVREILIQEERHAFGSCIWPATRSSISAR